MKVNLKDLTALLVKNLLFAIVPILISCIICKAQDNYYIPDGTVKERLIEGIGRTQHCIDFCVHDFASLDVGKELLVAREKGVRVRIVVVENNSTTVKGLLAESLINKGFDVRVLRPWFNGNGMEDFIIFDERTLVTGAYNWLAYKNRNICNDVIIYYDTERICTYKNMFYRLFADGEAVPVKELVATSTIPQYGTVTNIAEAEQAIKGNMPSGEESVASEILNETVPETISGEFIDLSFEEMTNKFGKGSTLSRSEKNNLWKKYKNKYVRWRGIIVHRGMGRVDWNRVGVSYKNGRNADAEIMFDWKMFDEVTSMRIGFTITFTGKLVSRPGLNSPCRIEDVNLVE